MVAVSGGVSRAAAGIGEYAVVVNGNMVAPVVDATTRRCCWSRCCRCRSGAVAPASVMPVLTAIELVGGRASGRAVEPL